MKLSRSVFVVAGAVVLLHLVTNTQYGFHRDELATVDDARHLAWGFVAYPPLTPFVGRVALLLFGRSLVGLRLFSSLAIAAATVLAGMIARELGGRRGAQFLAAAAVAIAPVALGSGSLFQYVSFDYLWWVVIAYSVVRLLNTGDARWWLAIGAATGLGVLTKYTIAFFTAGFALALLFTPGRRYLASRWLWIGAALSVAIAAPNLIWQAQHGFVSLDFLRSIHARDVRIGRADHFLPEQLFVPANVFTIPLWVAGLIGLLVSQGMRRYRVLAWTFLITVAIFLLAKGRSYYTAPAYPMLLAAGAVRFEARAAAWKTPARRLAWTGAACLLALGAALAAYLVVPIAPPGSGWFLAAARINTDYNEEIGWPNLVASVAYVYNSLPPAERAHAAILAANYGEAGALDLYGPDYGLPPAISGINSYWARGYGNPPPQTLVVLGFQPAFINQTFVSCSAAARITNPWGIHNEEASRPTIFLCRGLREPWPDFWKRFRYFGRLREPARMKVIHSLGGTA